MMTIIDMNHLRTASDLAYFADLLSSPGPLPQIPLHEYGPLNIQFSVIEGTAAENAERFAEIAADLREIADDQSLKFSMGTTQITGPDKHHKATLVMPQGKVTYTAVWIERAEQVSTDE